MTKLFFSALILSFFLSFPTAAVSMDNPPEAGDCLPVFAFQAPYTITEKKYLGIGDVDDFTLEELEAEFFLIEVVGTYCPICHIQSDDVNRLFNRIVMDEELSARMLMFAVSSGSTDTEIEYLRETWQAPYPILPDFDYEFFNFIGSPGVPFTLIVSCDGRIHYTNTGRMQEISAYLEKIREIVR